jgi:hypothetical protein
MPSEQHRELALQAIRSRIERFNAVLTNTTDQVRGMLAGSDNAGDDQSVALGFFAKGRMDIDRFNALVGKEARIEVSAEAPIRLAQEVLTSLLAQGDDLYVLNVEQGDELGRKVKARLASIGTAFAAARVIELARNNRYREEEHSAILQSFPYAMWNSSERALAPALVIEVAGGDFRPSEVIPMLDNTMKIVFVVRGDAPPAALSRVISPGVFVQQETGDDALDAFAAFEGIAVAAFVPSTAASFVHDPAAGSIVFDRFTAVTFPKEVQKRAIGSISPSQQAEDYTLLESLSVPPEVEGDAASDPAGKLSAWLLSQTDLSNLSA